MKVLISIPAYNEEKSIGAVIDEIHSVMKKTKYQYAIAVIDDGSKDKTVEIATRRGAQVVVHPINQGLAEAFRTEIKNFLASKYDVFVHIDADGQYKAEDIPKLVEEVSKGYDLVLGDRFSGGIEEMPFMKKFGNRVFSKVISDIIKYKVNDCQTGFRAFNKKTAQIPIRSTHTYTQEQIIRAVQEKLKIKEVPTYFRKRDGESRLLKNPFEYAFRAWINILRIYRDYDPMKFFGRIGITLIVFGFIIGLYLVYLFITTGKVGHLPLTLLTVMLFVMGIQIIVFGFMADMKKES
ncbi:MAG: glycosyltransferase family 2 protein [Candidatus Woesearchaeota archaeon]|nr:glycosyltransferase family 2 protein [Candidatus Woesearchaeota archaeon]